MKKYTVILRRSNFLMDIYDDDNELYVANSNAKFASVVEAAKAAKIEAAKADKPDVHGLLMERGVSCRNYKAFEIDPGNYEVVMVFEGQHKPVFGWQPELAALN